MAPGYYLWRNYQNPTGIGNIFMAWEAEKPVGCFGYTPKRVQYRKKVWIAAEINDAFVDGNHQGRGIFGRLVAAAIASASRQGIQFLYGLPNTTVYSIYIKRLGFVELATSDLRLVVSPCGRALGGDPDLKENCFTMESVEPQPAGPARAGDTLEIVHDEEYLRWRFEKHPDDYVILDHRVLVKSGTWGRLRVGYLADLLVRRGETSELLEGLTLARQYFRRMKMHLVAAWVDLNRVPLHRLLISGWMPYRRKRLVIRPLDRSFVPEDIREIVFFMADSDNI